MKFKQTEIDEIPRGWEECIFSEAVHVNPKRVLKKGSVAKFVSMTELKEFNRKIQGFTFRKFSGGSKFINGDTLMARITPCLENGKTALVDILENGEVGCGSTEFIVLSGKDGRSINQFVYYFATSPEIRQRAIKSMTGTSGRQRVESDVFDKIFINMPILTEQRAIAKILSDLDDKIELNHQMNKTLESIAQAIFKRWFVDFEFLGYEKTRFVNGLPEGWVYLPLDQIADFLNGLALQKYPPKGDIYLPVIKIRELNQGITESTDKASAEIDPAYIVDDGDVLFSWSGSLDVIIWGHGKGALNQHLFKVTSKKYPKWFYYFWIKQHLPDFRHIAAGKATTMGHIQRHHLSDAMVLTPPKEILQTITEVVEPMINKIINNLIEIGKLRDIRDSLLPRMMSGKIRIGG